MSTLVMGFGQSRRLFMMKSSAPIVAALGGWTVSAACGQYLRPSSDAHSARCLIDRPQLEASEQSGQDPDIVGISEMASLRHHLRNE